MNRRKKPPQEDSNLLAAAGYNTGMKLQILWRWNRNAVAGGSGAIDTLNHPNGLGSLRSIDPEWLSLRQTGIIVGNQFLMSEPPICFFSLPEGGLCGVLHAAVTVLNRQGVLEREHRFFTYDFQFDGGGGAIVVRRVKNRPATISEGEYAVCGIFNLDAIL